MNVERSIAVQAIANMTLGELPSGVDARKVYAATRHAAGLSNRPGQWLSLPTDNQKYGKGKGRLIYGMALAPHTASGVNACPWEDDCAATCVASTGNGLYANVGQARAARTMMWVEHAAEALRLLVWELDKAVDRFGAENIACRLNTFSDIRWERVLPVWFWDRYAEVKFYDYTKAPIRARQELPANYSLTYSVSGRSTDAEVAKNRAAGRPVAVVIETLAGKVRGTDEYRPLPNVVGAPVVDGDKNDRRYDDPAGALVLLRRKGSLRVDDPLVRDPGALITA